jgi:hypothetical protein
VVTVAEPSSSPSISSVSPAPSDEEVAAIAAAVEVLWPKPVVAGAAPQAPRSAAWRFSGRWWSLPLPVRRDRPYR